MHKVTNLGSVEELKTIKRGNKIRHVSSEPWRLRGTRRHS